MTFQGGESDNDCGVGKAAVWLNVNASHWSECEWRRERGASHVDVPAQAANRRSGLLEAGLGCFMFLVPFAEIPSVCVEAQAQDHLQASSFRIGSHNPTLRHGESL